jgi:hypothetical protein
MDGRYIAPGGALSPESLHMRGTGTGKMFSPGFRGPVSGRNTAMSGSVHGASSPVAMRSYSSQGKVNSP